MYLYNMHYLLNATKYIPMYYLVGKYLHPSGMYFSKEQYTILHSGWRFIAQEKRNNTIHTTVLCKIQQCNIPYVSKCIVKGRCVLVCGSPLNDE